MNWRRILILAWLGWVFDVMDASLFAFAKTRMLTEMLGGEAAYKLQGAAIEGRIQTLFLVGWAIGGFGFGVLADRWGRGKTLALTIGLYALFTGLTGLCQTPEQVALARFLTALGIGGEWAAGAALVAESVPDSFRPKAAALLQTAAAFGPILGGLANLALKEQSWRWLFAVGVLPAFLAFGFRLAEGHRPMEVKAAPETRLPLSTLLSPALRRSTLAAIVIGIVGVTGAGLIPFWLPNLVNAASEGLAKEAIVARTSYVTFALHGGTLAGVLLFPLLMARFGRRLPLALFFALAPITLLVALTGTPTYARLLLTLPFVSFVTIGLSAGFGLYFPELFPAALRATGAGLAYNAGRIVSAPMPAIVGAMAKGGNVAGAVLLAGGLYAFGLIAVVFAPETKGKGLQA